jgi:hypothetical protein
MYVHIFTLFGGKQRGERATPELKIRVVLARRGITSAPGTQDPSSIPARM